MTHIKNIYFSGEAFAILEQPMYENGHLLARSAKINRMILDKMEKVDDKTTNTIKDIEHRNKTIIHNLVTAINELDNFDKIYLAEFWRKEGYPNTMKKKFGRIISALAHVQNYFMDTLPPNRDEGLN